MAQFLAQDKFLSGLDDQHRKDCCKNFELRRVAAGVDVCKQGETGEEFFILLSGDVDLEIDGDHKKILPKGTSFGELALTGHTPDACKRTSTVRAHSKCVLAVLHVDQFKEAQTAREKHTDEERTGFKPVIDWTPLSKGDASALEIANTHGRFSKVLYVKIEPTAELDVGSPRKSGLVKKESIMEMVDPLKAIKSVDKCAHIRNDVCVFDKADAKKDKNGWATNKTINDDRLKGQVPTLYEVWNTTEAEIGAFGGPGMRLYFFVLRRLATLFCIMSLINIPSLVTFLNGDVYDESPLSPFGVTLAMTTLGNVDDTTEDIDDGKGSKIWWVACMSSLSSMVLLWMIVKMGHKMRVIIEESDHNAISMADYTVMISPVSGKQKKLTDSKSWLEYSSKKESASTLGGAMRATVEADIRTSIENSIAQGLAEGTTNVEVVANIGVDSVGRPKPAIWTCWDEEENIRNWRVKYNLFYQLELAMARAVNGEHEHLEKVLSKLEKLNQSLLTACAKAWRPVVAFVTFETPHHAALALKRQTLKVKGTTCAIQSAAEPESIQFENLQVSKISLKLRSFALNLITIILIIFAALGIVRVQIAVGGMAYLSDCDVIYGPDAAESVTLESSLCPAADVGDSYEDDMKAKYVTRYERDNLDTDNLYIFNPDTHYTISMNATHHQDPDELVKAACYACICNTITENWNNFTRAKTVDSETYCDEFNRDKMIDAAKSFLGSLAVVVVNQILKQFIVRTSGFLRAHTKEVEMQSKAIRVYMAQFMNTAILSFLINSNLPVFRKIRTAEHFDNSNFEWFAKVGAPMIKTMCVQFAVPWAAHVVFSYIFRLKACLGKSSLTQNFMNQSRESNNWDIAAGYGEVLMAMSVTLIYGSGVPLLYWVAAFGFLVRYWVDKWACLRVYKKPTLYGPELLLSFDQILAGVCFFHTMCAAYFIMCAGINGTIREHVESNQYVDERVNAPVILCAVMVGFAFIVCLWKYVDSLHTVIGACRRLMKSEDKADKIEMNMTIFEGLSLKMQREILAEMKEKKYEKGSIVMSKGETAETIFFVKSGVVETLESKSGRPVALVEEGDCFGDEVIFATDDKRLKYARCLTDVKLMVLLKKDLHTIIIKYSGKTKKNLEKIIAKKIKERYHCPTFSKAFSEGRIVNEDDNYEMDEFEPVE